MKRTRYQKAMDELHCPEAFMDKLKKQYLSANNVNQNENYYIYVRKNHKENNRLIKVAVVAALCISLFWGISVYTKDSKVSVPYNEIPVPVINEDEEMQRKLDYLNKNYFDFEVISHSSHSIYVLWNEENQLKLTINDINKTALMERSGKMLTIYLPNGMAPEEPNVSTQMYLKDIMGIGQDQLVVTSSIGGTKYVSMDMDIYNIETMERIPILEDIKKFVSKVQITFLGYYDEHITYLLTGPDDKQYLISEKIGMLDENADVNDFILTEEDVLYTSNYEFLMTEPGLKITCDIMPYYYNNERYCGQMVMKYRYDGTQFVMDEDTLSYTPGSNAVAVDGFNFQTRDESEGSTWYLSNAYGIQNYLIIELKDSVMDANLITPNASIKLSQLINKTNLHITWSISGKLVGIEYFADNSKSFFLYDVNQQQVIYEDFFDFDTIAAEFEQQGIYLLTMPQQGKNMQEYHITGIDEENSILHVHYSFTDKEQLTRSGSFDFNFQTSEYSNLKKEYQEITDQFHSWDIATFGEDFKNILMQKLSDLLSKQENLDTELLAKISPNLTVTVFDDHCIIEYKENPLIYHSDKRYQIRWEPGVASIIDSYEDQDDNS